MLFSKNTIAIQLIPKKNINLGLLNCTGTSYTAMLLKLYKFMATNYSSILPKIGKGLHLKMERIKKLELW